MFERILVANRGEVAARVARTCRRLGIETVGIHTSAEEGAVHVEACDASFPVGDAPEAYLDIEAVVRIARQVGAHAVHPGYGALCDNRRLASAVEAEGLVFLGSGSGRFDASRDRMAVLRVAQEAGIRVREGSERPILEPNEALVDVDRIGYPVVVKPVNGFGRPPNARVAEDVAQLSDALSALGDLEATGGTYVEARPERDRHVEVQVVFDGIDVHVLGDRDVSLHRNGRRVLTEAPATALDQLFDHEAVRGALWDAASEVTARLGCPGIAACEFAVDADSLVAFTGFVPGLQMGHTVTEMCTGLDLVELQLLLSTGERLPSRILRIEPNGSAVQARIDASVDPATGLPFASRIDQVRWPPAPQGKVRIEAGVRPGMTMHPAYDPTVATVTTYGPGRLDAVLTLDRILAEIDLRPLVSNVRLLRRALNHESLRAGQYDEDFLERCCM